MPIEKLSIVSPYLILPPSDHEQGFPSSALSCLQASAINTARCPGQFVVEEKGDLHRLEYDYTSGGDVPLFPSEGGEYLFGSKMLCGVDDVVPRY